MGEEPCGLIKVPKLLTHTESFKIVLFKLPLT